MECSKKETFTDIPVINDYTILVSIKMRSNPGILYSLISIILWEKIIFGSF